MWKVTISDGPVIDVSACFSIYRFNRPHDTIARFRRRQLNRVVVEIACSPFVRTLGG